MNNIPLAAWIVIILVGLFVIALYFILAAIIRNPNQFKPPFKSNQRPPGGAAENIRRLGQAIRDPLANERKQYNELSDLVSHLQDKDKKE